MQWLLSVSVQGAYQAGLASAPFFQAIGVLFAIARTETFNWVTARLGIITTSKSKFVRSMRPERRNW